MALGYGKGALERRNCMGLVRYIGLNLPIVQLLLLACMAQDDLWKEQRVGDCQRGRLQGKRLHRLCRLQFEAGGVKQREETGGRIGL